MAIDAGRLFATIQLERDDLSYVSGAEVRTPVVYATTRAEATSKGGSESDKGQSIASLARWEFLIRYRTDVKPQHRVIYQGVRYEITAMSEDVEYRQSITLECQTYGE